MRIGPRNDLTDVNGVAVGHYQRTGRGWLTGTTVVLPPHGTIGGLDVRGGAPGTRETDPLDPLNMVDEVDGICLTGGSAYGLDAAGGVMAWLEQHERGFRIGPESHHVVPIVPSAVIFDLGAGGRFANRPTGEFGWRAAAAARARRVRQGNVGAGTGGHAAALKGGIGSASVVTPDDITVAALVVVNSGGSPVDPANGELWGVRWGHRRRVRPSAPAHSRRGRRVPPARVRATADEHDVGGDRHGRGAEQDGVHPPGRCRTRRDGAGDQPDPHLHDGDVCFTLATGRCQLPEAPKETFIRPRDSRFGQLATIISAAADTVTRAIVHAVLAATSAGSMPSYLDQLPSALRPTRR